MGSFTLLMIMLVAITGILATETVGDNTGDYSDSNENENDLKTIVKYGYEVDDHNGNKQSKKEIIDGDTARGEYRTLLPDGRNQVVMYESGPHGHLANVAYEGSTDTSTHTSAPIYSPAPSYESAPSYAPTTMYAPVSYKPAVKPLHHTFTHIEYAKISKPRLVRMLRLVRTLRILINLRPNLGIRFQPISSTFKPVDLINQQLPRRTRLLLKLRLLPTRWFFPTGPHLRLLDTF